MERSKSLIPTILSLSLLTACDPQARTKKYTKKDERIEKVMREKELDACGKDLLNEITEEAFKKVTKTGEREKVRTWEEEWQKRREEKYKIAKWIPSLQ